MAASCSPLRGVPAIQGLLLPSQQAVMGHCRNPGNTSQSTSMYKIHGSQTLQESLVCMAGSQCAMEH